MSKLGIRRLVGGDCTIGMGVKTVVFPVRAFFIHNIKFFKVAKWRKYRQSIVSLVSLIRGLA